LALGAFMFNLLAIVLVYVAGEQAREENCEKVSEAFDVFTDRLIAAAGAAGETEAEAFRVDIHEALNDCS
jgi:hypothetical protein